jgi:hypothetical protein
MTTLDEGIFAYLKATAGITALVSSRIYPLVLPQEPTLPALVVTRISTPRIVSHDTSGATGDLISPRYQFDAWGTSQAATKAIADALRAALNGKTGAAGGITLRAALSEDEAHDYDPETGLYRIRSDYFIWYEE